MKDWRLQGQEKYLKGATLKRQEYKACREGLDHDHCEFCNTKFCKADPASLHVGYSTLNNYHWVCDNCFKDFNKLFEWNRIKKPLE